MGNKIDKPYKDYFLKSPSRQEVVENWRADMENHTGFDITMIFYSNGKVGVGIDRAGFFIFSGIEVLIDEASGVYIAEKLTIPDSDGYHLIDFFKHVHNKSRRCT